MLGAFVHDMVLGNTHCLYGQSHSGEFQWIVKLNPAYYMLEIYRDALFYGKFPELEHPYTIPGFFGCIVCTRRPVFPKNKTRVW